MTQDSSVSLHPYFKIHPGKTAAFKDLCTRFIEKTKTESGCICYGFSFSDDIVYCREIYVDGAALMAHAENVGELIQEALTLSDVHRLEVHGPAAELDKLRESPLGAMNPQYFVWEAGIRK